MHVTLSPMLLSARCRAEAWLWPYRDFEEYFGSIWKAGQTKFYVALSSLLDEGYLTELEPQETAQPARCIA